MSGQVRTTNPFNLITGGVATSALPPQPNAANPLAANPLFGRPVWTYVDVTRGPVRGPQPRLAIGTGGQIGKPGSAAQLPGYLTDNEYKPDSFDYQPAARESFLLRVPKTVNIGSDGRETVSSYQPHDFTPANRFLSQMRQAANWQVQAFPPDYRNLLAYQMVMKYQVIARTRSARPLSQADYILGYTVNPQVQAKIGQNALGYLGSMG